MIIDCSNRKNLPALIKEGASEEEWRARRREIFEILQKEEYGFFPNGKPVVTVLSESEQRGFAGKAITGIVKLHVQCEGFSYSFPVSYAFPIGHQASPVFVHINFRDLVPDIYLPAEEIIDHGFGFAQFCYKDVVNDNLFGDFSDGLGKAYYGGRPREKSEWGKIGMWAFSASRVIDWLETRGEADSKHIMVCGHSRLGKTALWCGGSDERVWATFSNDSGAGGSAIMRGKQGERIWDSANYGAEDWYCEKYKSWVDREWEMPFDQHFAMALVAPRLLCIGSAESDWWADPESECLAAEIASEAWEIYGKTGLVMDRKPQPGDAFLEGCVGYQFRKGDHFLSRTDWQRYMQFAKHHLALEEKG